MNRIILAISATFLTSLCQASLPLEIAREQRYEHTTDWSRGGSLAWLATLRDHARTVFYVDQAPETWIREADVAALVAAIDSDVPAGAACPLISPHRVPDDFHSTVGHEAALLVDAFRHERPYPTRCSDLTVVDRAELRQWWTRTKR